MGIVIRMFYDDHPPPHFRAEYGNYKAQLDLKKLELIEGELPPRIRAVVIRWATEHRTELLDNWERREERKPLAKIEPI